MQGYRVIECIYILTNILKGTAFLLEGLTENDSKGKIVTI